MTQSDRLVNSLIGLHNWPTTASTTAGIMSTSELPALSPSTSNNPDTPNGRRPSVIDETIARPGAVRINVKGAFIVDEGSPDDGVFGGHGPVHDNRDIRLPHHTKAVSHVAIDVHIAFLSSRCRG